MKKNINFYFFVLFFFLFVFAFIFFIFSIISEIETPSSFSGINNIDNNNIKRNFTLDNLQKFSSEEEFLQYLSDSKQLQESFGGRTGLRTDFLVDDLLMDFMESAPLVSDSAATPERYSETNIQVMGIDEPDILKTDGINIFFSERHPRYHRFYHQPSELKTKIIKAFPYQDIKLLSEIEKGGNLFLQDNILVIIQNDKILGYNVENTNNPKKIWEVEINDNTVTSSARLKNGVIYLVIQNNFSTDNPCVIHPLTFNDEEFTVRCTDIYYPGVVVPIDITYTALKIDLKDGTKKGNVSFVGSRNTSITYMSHNNLYLSYFKQAEMLEFVASFFSEDCRDIISNSVIKKLEKLNSYDISSQAKMVEMGIILDNYFRSLSGDDRLKIENEITNRVGDYYEKNRRNLESTGIVKINLENFQIEATGSVPGNLLNQFALDEHQGNLRVATTVGERFSWAYGLPGGGVRTESANDVYVLNEDLKQIGSVKNLGMDERIYAVRFIGDMGYVVTFREIDPFYILDLSNPNNPEMKGELKIPGYSSYLHPISEDRMLGIGMEDWNVKASLFDISNPYDPREIDNYKLSERWSEAVQNHHAFLMDKKHEIFFIPGSQGGYIFSYKSDKISLQRAIEERNIQRALYIDDYLYIISNDKVIVLDQKTWEKVKDFNI